LHTLVLLDILVEKNQYMTANEGLELLLRMEDKLRKRLFSDDTIACVVARAGASDAVVAANTIKVLRKRDFGPPLHTLVIPGTLHFMEVEALELCAGLPSEVGNENLIMLPLHMKKVMCLRRSWISKGTLI
jgi:diphthamide biosynthesis methyltransferase